MRAKHHFLFAAAVLVMGCGEDLLEPAPAVYSRLDQGAFAVESYGLRMEVAFPQRVDQGATVVFNATVTNTTEDTLVIIHLGGDVFDAYDVVITRPDSTVVWEALYGVNYPDAGKLSSLPPGSTLEFTRSWNQQDVNGNMVAPGEYRARAVFLGIADHPEAGGAGIWTEPVTLVIQ